MLFNTNPGPSVTRALASVSHKMFSNDIYARQSANPDSTTDVICPNELTNREVKTAYPIQTSISRHCTRYWLLEAKSILLTSLKNLNLLRDCRLLALCAQHLYRS